jgi:hypothetical protein
LAERLRASARYLAHTWPQPLLRSLLVALLWWGSGQPGSPWLLGIPLGSWLAQAVLGACPRWGRTPTGHALHGLLRLTTPALLVALGGLWLGQWLGAQLAAGVPLREARAGAVPLFLGGGAVASEAPQVEVQRQEDGSYEATLDGRFTLRVAGDDPFRARWLLLFLRFLEIATPLRHSRPTPAGRYPFVRQTQVAAWFGCTQPEISRWEEYWRRATGQPLSLCGRKS